MGAMDDDLANEPLLQDFLSGDRAMTVPVLLREVLALRREIRARDQRDENAREAAAARGARGSR